MHLNQAILRQNLAEWRDVQIVSAAALVNLRATQAKEAFNSLLTADAFRESVFIPTEWATAHIDELMRAALGPELTTFLIIAADDLVSIDLSLSGVAEALRRDNAVTLPDASVATDGTELAAEEANGDEATSNTPPHLKAWITQMGGRMATGAAEIATNATATVNAVAAGPLQLRARLRNSAHHRIENFWMGEGGEPKAVLGQLISLIDEAAYAARTNLS